MFLFCLVFAMSLCASVYMCFVVTCWERAGLLALVCGVCCEFVTFPLVSWVRCGTWLYRFLIFAPLLTFIVCIILICLYDSFKGDNSNMKQERTSVLAQGKLSITEIHVYQNSIENYLSHVKKNYNILLIIRGLGQLPFSKQKKIFENVYLVLTGN